jgi:hypothetical protein
MDPINHSDIYRALGRLEGKLDGFLIEMGEHQKRLDSHGQRLAALERSKAWLLGAAAIIGAAASAVIHNIKGVIY